jgi:hypothetical protein
MKGTFGDYKINACSTGVCSSLRHALSSRCSCCYNATLVLLQPLLSHFNQTGRVVHNEEQQHSIPEAVYRLGVCAGSVCSSPNPASSKVELPAAPTDTDSGRTSPPAHPFCTLIRNAFQSFYQRELVTGGADWIKN